MYSIFFKDFLQTKKNSLFVSPYTINYKNVKMLRHYVKTTGKILPRRVTKLNAKDHRVTIKAIRQARRIRLLPFVWLRYFLINHVL